MLLSDSEIEMKEVSQNSEGSDDKNFPGPRVLIDYEQAHNHQIEDLKNMFSYHNGVCRLSQHDGSVDWKFCKLHALPFSILLQSHCGDH